ncbi:MAG: ABC transporter ATP-binding protein [Sulfolobales archaeon]
MYVAELIDVWKSYNDVYVLRGINLLVRGGEVVGIVGRSGVGKTTMIRLLGLLDRADSGIVRILGRDVGDLSDSEASRLRLKEIGIIPQQFNLIPHLTVLENIELPLYLQGVKKYEREAKALEMLKRFGLQYLASRYPNELSSGEQQRVLAIRAFIKSPRIVLADEPTAYLDIENSRIMYDMFKELISEYNSSVIITATNPEVHPLTVGSTY